MGAFLAFTDFTPGEKGAWEEKEVDTRLYKLDWFNSLPFLLFLL